MAVNDAVVEYRLRLVAVIEGSPNRRLACLQAGLHPSTFYRWRRRPRPRSPYRGLSFRERRLTELVISQALAYPEAGPQRLADLLTAQGMVVSASKIWRTLKVHRLNTRRLRYALLAQHRQTPPPPTIVVSARAAGYVGRLHAELPGDLVQMDCLHIGSFKETRLGETKHSHGQIWQYTAIDVASSWLWAELWTTPHNPSPAITSQLAHRVAADLNRHGWTWKTVSTDNGNEYRAQTFADTLTALGVEHRFIKAGRPQSNGKAERVQGTLLEELYQPALIGYVEPSISGLRHDLTAYLNYYNHQRPHHGKWNQGHTPAQIMIPNPKLHP